MHKCGVATDSYLRLRFNSISGQYGEVPRSLWSLLLPTIIAASVSSNPDLLRVLCIIKHPYSWMPAQYEVYGSVFDAASQKVHALAEMPYSKGAASKKAHVVCQAAI